MKYSKRTWTVPVSVLLFLVLLSAGCRTEDPLDDKPLLTVSILPQKYFVEKIAADQFSIQVMIPPGQSPATYDPAPEQMISLSKSSIYFRIGQIGFEKTLISEIQDDYPAINFFDTSQGIEFEQTDHEDGDHAHEGDDPHVWMSVRNVKQIARNMAGSLSQLYPENSSVYLKNLDKFETELDSLDKSISMELQNLTQREFIIYHPALTYFARDYDLVQIPLELEGKEPSPRYLKSLVDLATRNKIKAILVQQQFSKAEASTLEREINGKLIVIDPLDPDWMGQMKNITTQLKQALQGT